MFTTTRRTRRGWPRWRPDRPGQRGDTLHRSWWSPSASPTTAYWRRAASPRFSFLSN